MKKYFFAVFLIATIMLISTIAYCGNYDCKYTNEQITIDGKSNENAWNKAKVIKDFLIAGGKKKATYKTEAKILWDDKNLYFFFKAYDKDIWSYFTKRDDTTCREDCLEIFFKTNPKLPQYYDFEINALGTIYDSFIIKKNAIGGDHHRGYRWNLNTMKVAVTINGTINEPYKIDKYWQMEVAIPFEGLDTNKRMAPKAGDVWIYQIARCEYSFYLEQGQELSANEYLNEVNFHAPEFWSKLKFVK